jgi:hypothetical protein
MPAPSLIQVSANIGKITHSFIMTFSEQWKMKECPATLKINEVESNHTQANEANLKDIFKSDRYNSITACHILESDIFGGDRPAEQRA